MSSRPGDLCLIRQHEEQLLEVNKELSEVSSTLLSLDLDESYELMVKLSTFEQNVFDYSLRLRRMLQSLDSSASPAATPDTKGVKLPKIDVPTFNGHILNWKTLMSLLRHYFKAGRLAHRDLPRHLKQSLDECSLAPPISINRTQSSCPTAHLCCPVPTCYEDYPLRREK